MKSGTRSWGSCSSKQAHPGQGIARHADAQPRIDPADRSHWTSTADILTTLQANGLHGATRANAMYLSAVLKKVGLERKQQHDVKGYLGTW